MSFISHHHLHCRACVTLPPASANRLTIPARAVIELLWYLFIFFVLLPSHRGNALFYCVWDASAGNNVARYVLPHNYSISYSSVISIPVQGQHFILSIYFAHLLFQNMLSSAVFFFCWGILFRFPVLYDALVRSNAPNFILLLCCTVTRKSFSSLLLSLLFIFQSLYNQVDSFRLKSLLCETWE